MHISKFLHHMHNPWVQLPQEVLSLHGGLHVEMWSELSNGEKISRRLSSVVAISPSSFSSASSLPSFSISSMVDIVVVVLLICKVLEFSVGAGDGTTLPPLRRDVSLQREFLSMSHVQPGKRWKKFEWLVNLYELDIFMLTYVVLMIWKIQRIIRSITQHSKIN